ncbi:uncharacterized protein PGTG_18223 [Puccinia graminis f. sp. tritici CRL 75-36-700-3]|uniref:Uncharacterized protein n=1 Tax=Puccinia graminis f. sp. tritici (strain CRL 75-36-700-3 / race SCCL) TaxID=418459 RepID=E3L833_PUCGT|nr:uncharacterized protein PGTG_18223 [Puccinia graminis f. sp. tritici CRL 75-36-700-3]EFP92708.2 hypothetical protein PGTG_18223 [Puccinia graminis f. sp. tritici CRL 75-36-700-3]
MADTTNPTGPTGSATAQNVATEVGIIRQPRLSPTPSESPGRREETSDPNPDPNQRGHTPNTTGRRDSVNSRESTGLEIITETHANNPTNDEVFHRFPIEERFERYYYRMAENRAWLDQVNNQSTEEAIRAHLNYFRDDSVTRPRQRINQDSRVGSQLDPSIPLLKPDSKSPSKGQYPERITSGENCRQQQKYKQEPQPSEPTEPSHQKQSSASRGREHTSSSKPPSRETPYYERPASPQTGSRRKSREIPRTDSYEGSKEESRMENFNLLRDGQNRPFPPRNVSTSRGRKNSYSKRQSECASREPSRQPTRQK